MNNNNVLDLKPTKPPEVKETVRPMLHAYQDSVMAMHRHIKNMIETYGINQLNAVINDINKDKV